MQKPGVPGNHVRFHPMAYDCSSKLCSHRMIHVLTKGSTFMVGKPQASGLGTHHGRLSLMHTAPVMESPMWASGPCPCDWLGSLCVSYCLRHGCQEYAVGVPRSPRQDRTGWPANVIVSLDGSQGRISNAVLSSRTHPQRLELMPLLKCASFQPGETFEEPPYNIVGMVVVHEM